MLFKQWKIHMLLGLEDVLTTIMAEEFQVDELFCLGAEGALLFSTVDKI